jgi:hypothetical protein
MLDDPLEPVHWRTKCNVGGIGSTRASSEEGNEFPSGVDDDGSRVAAVGERTRVVIMAVDCYFHRIVAAAWGEVTANVGLKSRQTIVILVGERSYFVGGENPSEFEESIIWIFEIGRRIYARPARVRQGVELDGVDLGTWNMNS